MPQLAVRVVLARRVARERAGALDRVVGEAHGLGGGVGGCHPGGRRLRVGGRRLGGGGRRGSVRGRRSSCGRGSGSRGSTCTSPRSLARKALTLKLRAVDHEAAEAEPLGGRRLRRRRRLGLGRGRGCSGFVNDCRGKTRAFKLITGRDFLRVRLLVRLLALPLTLIILEATERGTDSRRHLVLRVALDHDWLVLRERGRDRPWISAPPH
jgi:hypothetical protein